MAYALMRQKLSRSYLRWATLEIAAKAGLSLSRVPGRQLIYQSSSGWFVRLRCNNDRCLVTTATCPSLTQAKLDIAGADFLLFGAPVTRRGTEAVEAYLVPIGIAIFAVKSSQKSKGRRGASEPSATKPAIWLDRKLPPADRFSERWSRYRIGSLHLAAAGVQDGLQREAS